jgi:hypothetical protein
VGVELGLGLSLTKKMHYLLTLLGPPNPLWAPPPPFFFGQKPKCSFGSLPCFFLFLVIPLYWIIGLSKKKQIGEYIGIGWICIGPTLFLTYLFLPAHWCVCLWPAHFLVCLSQAATIGLVILLGLQRQY